MGSTVSKETNHVWLDATVNTSQDNIKYQKILRESIHQFTTFDNHVECIKYIEKHSTNDRMILITSGSLGESVVPKIHELQQIFSIYIFCMNKDNHKQWTSKFIKIQGVFTDLKELIEQILHDKQLQKYKIDEQLSISISNASDHFVYSQLLINCLIQLPMTQAEKVELYKLCKIEYRSDNNEKQKINEFEKTYSNEKAIWWFTQDSFLHEMLIKAFRIQNLDLLFLFRFVIQDIQTQIERNHMSSVRIDVYRSQLITKNELEKLKDSLGQFISVNSFLSGILNREMAISILNKSSISNDNERVIFEIDADGRVPGVKPFTNIKSENINQHDEILFSVGSIFQLNDIRNEEGNIWIIQMKLCSNKNNKLQPLLNDTRSNPSSFGLALQEMLKYDEAENFYHRLIKISPSNTQLIKECNQTLMEINIQKELNRQQSISLMESIKKPRINGYSLALDYIAKGEEYRKQENLQQALEWYQKALSTLKQSHGDDHLEVGRCYNKIGLIYQENNNYDEARQYYEEARTIFEKHFPPDHSILNEINNQSD